MKIFGTLSCSSGKRMKMENRIFFESEEEAINAGYRPCGHCLREKYVQWKFFSPPTTPGQAQRREDTKER